MNETFNCYFLPSKSKEMDAYSRKSFDYTRLFAQRFYPAHNFEATVEKSVTVAIRNFIKMTSRLKKVEKLHRCGHVYFTHPQ